MSPVPSLFTTLVYDFTHGRLTEISIMICQGLRCRLRLPHLPLGMQHLSTRISLLEYPRICILWSQSRRQPEYTWLSSFPWLLGEYVTFRTNQDSDFAQEYLQPIELSSIYFFTYDSCLWQFQNSAWVFYDLKVSWDNFWKEIERDSLQNCCHNASGVRHIPELCQINSCMCMFKGLDGNGYSTNLARFQDSFDHWWWELTKMFRREMFWYVKHLMQWWATSLLGKNQIKSHESLDSRGR